MDDAPDSAPADLHDARARQLLAGMTLQEKVAQIVGLWGEDGGSVVAPMQDEMSAPQNAVETFAADGIGHLTRVYGTTPVDPLERLMWLRDLQRWFRTSTRLGIPALVHEECLTGLCSWHATTYPAPLAWGASFDPQLVAEMGAAIGDSMRTLGVHQGLAPVLDVIRDARWGRVEECISEDPYLVGSIGTSFVRGLQGAGVIATLKHFVGYSASVAGRNLAPARVGPRELIDVLLIPFEMAVLDGGARSVMHSYAEIDGLPVAADPGLLTGLLRDEWGFEGTVVADYFGVAFLQALHGVAADLGDAAALALEAGVDIELPTGNAYLEPLIAKVRDGELPESLVDRAVLRALRQKSELGLLDEDYDMAVPEIIDLDPAPHRAIAARLAEESVILLGNDGVLPLPGTGRIAVIGPNADRSQALFGCYSFANHVLDHHPDVLLGISAPTVLEAVRAEWPAADVSYATGCAVDDADRSGFAGAIEVAAAADIAVVVVGDQAGLFGRGTVGEGCDRESLELPGVQRGLIEAVLDTGTSVVLVLLTGRPYAVGWALERCRAVVQAFFPGEEGSAAITGVLSGRVNPSGRLPVSLPRSGGAQPYSYLHPFLGGPTSVSSLDTTPAMPFGHGLSYTSFSHSDLTAHGPHGVGRVPAGGTVEVTVRTTNTGERRGADVVQLYARDVVGSVTRPSAQLLGYRRVDLEPAESVVVRFTVPTTRLAFADRGMRRIVEPGDVELWVGASCASRETSAALQVTGPAHHVTVGDARMVATELVRGRHRAGLG